MLVVVKIFFRGSNTFVAECINAANASEFCLPPGNDLQATLRKDFSPLKHMMNVVLWILN